MHLSHPYAVLDVFTDRALAGNPLAVVLEASGLDDTRMQAIAREFNLSETVFVLPPDNRMHSARVRIFTPARELPFAGHPTVGTAVLLACRKWSAGATGKESVIVLEETVGPVRCGVFIKDERSAHAIFDLPKLPEPVEGDLDRDMVAAALGIEPSEIGFENHELCRFSAGLPYSFVPVRDLATIARTAPDRAHWAAAFGQSSHPNAYLYCRETEGNGHHFHARMFAPTLGISEDPATGSAAAAFAGVVHRFDGLRSGTHRFTIEQGFEMGRPSLIKLEIDADQGAIAAARIGGDAVMIAEGLLTV
ncbi:PhzF family phenazine biosynthesis protein [soil metagenome]